MKPELATDRLPAACLAPPMTDEKIAAYKSLAASQGGEIGDAMATCLRCVEAWWELPESKLPPRKWSTKIGKANGTINVVPLEAEHVAALDAVTPWLRELNSMDGLFDMLPTGDVRNAAFMLLWYAKEIALDREPVTQEKLSVA